MAETKTREPSIAGPHEGKVGESFLLELAGLGGEVDVVVTVLDPGRPHPLSTSAKSDADGSLRFSAAGHGKGQCVVMFGFPDGVLQHAVQVK